MIKIYLLFKFFQIFYKTTLVPYGETSSPFLFRIVNIF